MGNIDKRFAGIRGETTHNAEETLIYTEHKGTVYRSGGDCEYMLRSRYMVTGVDTHEYVVDKELLPEFREYLAGQGMKTSVRETPKPARYAVRPRTGISNPGFAFPYRGTVYKQCLVCAPDKGCDTYYICNPNYRLRIPFTLPGDTPSKARITDTYIYDWMEASGYILESFGTENIGGETFPVVAFDDKRLLAKGRQGILVAKEILDGRTVFKEERYLFNLMSPFLSGIRNKYENGINLLQFKFESLRDDFPGKAKTAWKELEKARQDYDREEKAAVKAAFLKLHPGAVFVRRLIVDRECIRKEKDDDMFSYVFPAGHTLEGWELAMPVQFLEKPKKESRPCIIALPEDEPRMLWRKGKKKQVSFMKLVEALGNKKTDKEEPDDEQGDTAV